MPMIFMFVFFMSVIMPFPAKAQIIGSINPNISVDALSKGDPAKGFGFSALRYEDKQRLKKLRERYLELNPKNRGIVTVYDIEDDEKKSGDDAASNSQNVEAKNTPK